MSKFVAYVRVSTTKQGASRLGLEAQRTAIREYVRRVDGEITFTFEEVDSGGHAARPELQKALQHCRLTRAMLVVAKLDRLARSVHFISQLMESGVDFVAADMPEANKLTIHIIAAVAEYERQLISERTKNALKSARTRLQTLGRTLGNPRVKEAQRKGTIAAIQKADAFALKMAKVLKLHDPEGKLSANKLAEILNAEGIRGANNGLWTPATIIALRRRILRLQNY